MRLFTTISVLALLSTLSVPLNARQDHHTSMDKRGAMVMGFDQQQTTHHFLLFTDGGAIDVGVKDGADRKNLEASRSHLPHIAAMFGAGNFEAPMLVHDSKNVPGAKEMAASKDRIQYRYVETTAGGRVDASTDLGLHIRGGYFVRLELPREGLVRSFGCSPATELIDRGIS
jgi:hypothetical protein